MLWWFIAVMISLATGIVTLAAAGADPPARIQTFSHSSPAEREFDRRAGRLLMIGVVSIGIGLLMGLVCAATSLQLHH